jgi:hypothetical protein
MMDNALLLKPYEDYLNGIEQELRDLIRFIKSVFYCSTSETWASERAVLIEMDDEHLKLMEALPEY